MRWCLRLIPTAPILGRWRGKIDSYYCLDNLDRTCSTVHCPSELSAKRPKQRLLFSLHLPSGGDRFSLQWEISICVVDPTNGLCPSFYENIDLTSAGGGGGGIVGVVDPASGLCGPLQVDSPLSNISADIFLRTMTRAVTQRI